MLGKGSGSCRQQVRAKSEGTKKAKVCGAENRCYGRNELALGDLKFGDRMPSNMIYHLNRPLVTRAWLEGGHRWVTASRLFPGIRTQSEALFATLLYGGAESFLIMDEVASWPDVREDVL